MEFALSRSFILRIAAARAPSMRGCRKIIRNQEHRHISDRQTSVSISEVAALLAKRLPSGIVVGTSPK
jgi:hypothetical protein